MSMVVLGRIDVVALKNLSRNDSEKIFNKMKKIVENANNRIYNFNEANQSSNHLTVRGLYGDTIDLYFQKNADIGPMLMYLLEVMTCIERDALDMGMLVRGAVVVGDLLITDSIFTGTAMVSAAEIESKLSTYGIGIQDKIMEIVKKTIPSFLQFDELITTFHNSNFYKNDDITILNISRNMSIADANFVDVDYLNKHKLVLTSTLKKYSKLPLTGGNAERSKVAKLIRNSIHNHNRVCDMVERSDLKINDKL